MPLYEYKCPVCGNHAEQFAKIAERDLNKPVCCGLEMERAISAPSFTKEMTPYKSMATGQMITSRTQHKQMLKTHGLVEIGDQHAAHQKQIEQNKAAKAKQESVELRKEIAARIDTITN